MRLRIMLMLAVAVLIAMPGVVKATVVNTAHDLPTSLGLAATDSKQGTCSFCHIPHKADGGGEKLFPLSYTGGLPATWSSDTLSNICWYCHGATSGYTTARQVNPFQASSHKRDTTLLTDGIGSTADAADIGSVPGDLDAVGTDLACVSCHAIHDNTNRPFMRWGDRGEFHSDATDGGFCAKCHANRSNTSSVGTANPGNHPSYSTYSDGTGGGSPVVGAALPTIMQVPPDNGGTPNWDGTTYAAAYNLGGKANSPGGTEVTTGMVCGSCHAVHSNETTVWDATDGASPVAAAVPMGGSPLLVDKGSATLTTEQSAAICEECHSIVYGRGQRGPGATGTISHPIGLGSTVADAMLSAGSGYKWNDDGTNTMIVCQSCHDIHWSANNATTRGAGDYLLAEGTCEGCHSGDTGYADHHPSGIANANTLVNGTATSETTASGDTNWVAGTQTNDGVNYWATSTTMTCQTCHGLGTSGAHNNTGAFPGLTGRNAESDMCVDCHSMNPSTYTAGTQGTGSHYVGDIITASFKQYTAAAWSDTGAYSQYSADGGSNGSIICESCHSVAITGRTGSPSGYTNSDVTAYAASDNGATGSDDPKPAVSLLLQTAGNTHASAAAADYMCTGCHGGTPGGGLTHPVLPVHTTAATMAGSEGGTTTFNTGNQINCESCHRPHDANTAVTTWILENGSNADGYRDFTPLCADCHTQGQ